VTNYEKGRAWEYAVSDMLFSKGWTIIRSAGSHTAVDLIAGRYLEASNQRRVIVIQCKVGQSKFDEDEKERLLDAARAFNARAILASRRGNKRSYVILPDPPQMQEVITEDWFK